MLSVIAPLTEAFLASFALNTLVFGIIALLISRAEAERATRGQLLALILGMSALGTCAGFTGGLSRESAVGPIISAMFGIFGGVSVYLFGIDRSRGAVASLMVACLSVSLFLAFVVSAQFRNYNDELRDLRTHCIAAYTDGNIIGKTTGARGVRGAVHALLPHGPGLEPRWISSRPACEKIASCRVATLPIYRTSRRDRRSFSPSD